MGVCIELGIGIGTTSTPVQDAFRTLQQIRYEINPVSPNCDVKIWLIFMQSHCELHVYIFFDLKIGSVFLWVRNPTG